MDIRVAEEKDLEMLQALMIKTWRETYPDYIIKQGENAIAKEIAERFSIEKISSYFIGTNHRIWIAVDSQNNMVGYSHIILPESNKKPAFLHQIYIIKDEQGKGLGSLLIKQCYLYLKEKNIFEMELEVDVENMNAINFYKKQGFNIIKQVPYDIPGYFDYLMKKTLIISPGIHGLWFVDEQNPNMCVGKAPNCHG